MFAPKTDYCKMHWLPENFSTINSGAQGLLSKTKGFKLEFPEGYQCYSKPGMVYLFVTATRQVYSGMMLAKRLSVEKFLHKQIM